mgnify:CR=1 FL=1
MKPLSTPRPVRASNPFSTEFSHKLDPERASGLTASSASMAHNFTVLRFREPHVARPFKVPLYPILPIVFVVTCGYLFYSSVMYAQSQQAVHITFWVMGFGAVAWALMRALKRRWRWLPISWPI